MRATQEISSMLPCSLRQILQSRRNVIQRLGALSCGLLAACGTEANPGVVASYEAEGVRVFFIEREPLEDETGLDRPIVDVATIAKVDSSDSTEALLDQGATPLELFYALMPESVAPASLAVHHDFVTAEQGRDSSDIREYSSWRDSWSVAASTRCNNSSNFSNYIANEAMAPGYSLSMVELPSATPEVMYTAVSTSTKDIRVRVCNRLSNRDDTVDGDVFVQSSSGVRTVVWRTQDPPNVLDLPPNIGDGYLMMYSFDSGTSGLKYGVRLHSPRAYVDHPEGFFESCNGSNCNVATYMAAGRQP